MLSKLQQRWLGLALVVVYTVAFAGAAMPAGAATEVPIAQSVEIVGAAPATGSVVSYDETADEFRVSRAPRDETAYGVVGERPAIVFVSATNTIPVITNGVTYVRVSDEAGEIARGDVLTTASEPGLAMRASATSTAVFAIALEPAVFASGVGEAVILAEVGVERAQAYQAAARAALVEEEEASTSWIRYAVAGVLVIGGMSFLLYSFRAILAVGIQSVGRNPRARRAVIVLAVVSLLALLAITGLLLLAAVGVLVLPV